MLPLWRDRVRIVLCRDRLIVVQMQGGSDIYATDYDALPRDPKTARAERTEDGKVFPAYAGTLYYEEQTIRDIVGKFVKYGSINDAQMELVRKLTERIPDRDKRNAEWEAKRKAEKAAAKPCPKGRVKIEGIVVKTETKETAWGFREVMVVKSVDGWVCWCSDALRCNGGEGL